MVSPVNIRICFKLTVLSLKRLKYEDIPEDIITLLKALENRPYIEEIEFIEDLKNTIGEENTNTYKHLILKHAKIGIPEKYGESLECFLGKYANLIHKIIHKTIQNNPELEERDLFNSFFVHISDNDFERLKQCKEEDEEKCKHYLEVMLKNFICDKFRGKVKIRFELTRRSLEELKSKKIPAGMVNLLEKFINQTYNCKEQFEDALKNAIGEESFKSYKPLILDHAKINTPKIIFGVITTEEFDIFTEPEQERLVILTEERELIKDVLANRTLSRLSESEKSIYKLTYEQEWDAQAIADFLEIDINHVYEGRRKIKKVFKEELIYKLFYEWGWDVQTISDFLEIDINCFLKVKSKLENFFKRRNKKKADKHEQKSVRSLIKEKNLNYINNDKEIGPWGKRIK